MKKILTVLFLVINIVCFSQNVQKLEYELSYINVGEEWGNKKEIAFKLLQIDKLNTTAIDYLVEVYGRNNQRDSISILFDRLIKDHPKSPVPYIIRAKERNANFAALDYFQRISYLEKAYNIDSLNTEAIYLLGKLYYELFIQEYSNKELENLKLFSTNSAKYFSILYNQNVYYQDYLKFPLLQLVNFIGDEDKKMRYENCKVQSSYFPVSAFVNIPNDWQTNYSINVIDFSSGPRWKFSGIESAMFHNNWYSEYLNALDEPILRDSLPTMVFRFTWLRSFHNPIVIGIENSDGSILIYWKISDGTGGYEPGKMIKNKSKKLTIKEWSEIVAAIEEIDFWNLPSTDHEISGSDGAQWILEGKELGKYHVVDRWSGGATESVCRKLIKLTDIKIKEDEIY